MLYCSSYLIPTVKFWSSFGTYPVSLRRSGFILVALLRLAVGWIR